MRSPAWRRGKTPVEPAIRTLPAITVAGLQVRGKAGETDLGGLWGALGSRATEIEPRAERHLAYGVTFGFDPAAREFNYLAGYPVEPTFWAPTGISLIHVPSQDHAAFATTLPA